MRAIRYFEESARWALPGVRGFPALACQTHHNRHGFAGGGQSSFFPAQFIKPVRTQVQISSITSGDITRAAWVVGGFHGGYRG